MELSQDFIEVQSILRNSMKQIGDLHKIKHKSGNEMKISALIKDIEMHLTKRNYIIKWKHNPEKTPEIKSIIYFLILNTEFKEDLFSDVEDVAHLIYICPLLSKCLLANIIIDLDLVVPYSKLIDVLPLKVLEEMLPELIPCIRKISIKFSLQYCYVLGCAIIKQVSKLNGNIQKERESSDVLIEACCEMLCILSGIKLEQINNMEFLYKHMGYTLLYLLRLFQNISFKNERFSKLTVCLRDTTTKVLKAVTVDIYCSWAEIDFETKTLQATIQEEAYKACEICSNCESMKTLSQMLAPISQKPKSIAEIINVSDTATIIKKINAVDNDQQKWFSALLNTEIFQNQEAIECLKKWSHLCFAEDVYCILTKSSNIKDEKISNVVLKCFVHMSTEDVILTITRFYHEQGICTNYETKDLSNNLILILNKIQIEEESYLNSLLLLFFQNPYYVLEELFKECVKNSIYVKCLKRFFEETKIILQIESLAVKTIERTFENIKLNERNIKNYGELLNTLIEIDVLNFHKTFRILKSFIIKSYQNKDYKELVYTLILFDCQIPYFKTDDEFKEILTFFVKILDENRVKFFEFSEEKQDVNEKIVVFLWKYIEYLKRENIILLEVEELESEHYLNKYYISHIRNDFRGSFFDFLLPNFNANCYGECVTKFLKLWPSCVLPEIFSLVSSLELKYEYVKIVELLTDVMVLLCQLANTQMKSENYDSVICCLKCCLQNYGIVLKEQLLCKVKEHSDQILVTKAICRLIKEIPCEVKEEEGIKLITLLPDDVLKSMKEDKPFVLSLVSLDNAKITQFIAKRMLS